jgi:protein-L-isoaspartate(D-aspartate) O-methyltransferase
LPKLRAKTAGRGQNPQYVNEIAALLEQLRAHVADARVLEAIATIPRERFVPAAEQARAYENVALPIGCEQTISQPLVVARMLEVLELRASDRVLDIGTGSGYHAALLARLAGHVWTIERHADLARHAEEVIGSLAITNVTFAVGDGYDGLREQAPFDAINVAAAIGGSVPVELEHQLAVGGRLVAPVGETEQRLTLIRRTSAGLERQPLEPVRFVPLVRDHRDARA